MSTLDGFLKQRAHGHRPPALARAAKAKKYSRPLSIR
jgi:hypothetical protein